MTTQAGLIQDLAVRIAQEFNTLRGEVDDALNQVGGGYVLVPSVLDGGGASITSPSVVFDGGSA